MKRQHMMDVIFVITLFCVFALSTISVIYIGSQVYKNITDQMQSNFQTTTALNYVTEKVRQNNHTNGITLGTIEEKPALILAQNYAGQDYLTYIYQDDGQLKELFIKKTQLAHLNDGTIILPAEDFKMEFIDEQLLYFSISFEGGQNQTAYISVL